MNDQDFEQLKIFLIKMLNIRPCPSCGHGGPLESDPCEVRYLNTLMEYNADLRNFIIKWKERFESI